VPDWSRLDLGVGVIAAAGVDLLWADIADLVDVVEVEPQTLWDRRHGNRTTMDRHALYWLRSLGRPLLSHGVGFPVGGTIAPDAAGVRASARSAAALDAVQWSEHLSFNRAGPDARQAGYLLPPVPAPAVVTAAVDHIGRFRDHLDRPFLVETPASYVRPMPGDLTDGQFVTAIAEGADCGILLDLHNIWANERNGRQPVAEFIAELPLERVWEVHLAGGFEYDGYYLDAHVGAVAPELLELAGDVLPRLPNLRAVLFEAVPESLAGLGAPGLRAVLAQLHDLIQRPLSTTRPRRRTATPARPPVTRAAASHPSPAAREEQLLAFTTRASDDRPDDDPGAEVLRFLTDEARLSLVVDDNLAALTRLLSSRGRRGTRDLLNDFLASTPASSWPEQQSAALTEWLGARRV
jgi:uncharacterized protein (UPF0276 family)